MGHVLERSTLWGVIGFLLIVSAVVGYFLGVSYVPVAGLGVFLLFLGCIYN